MSHASTGPAAGASPRPASAHAATPGLHRTGLIYSPRFLEHDTGSAHPERPARAAAIIERLERDGLLERLDRPDFEPADLKWIRFVHQEEYIDRLYNACRQGQPWIDVSESTICPASFEIAQLAVGGVLHACDRVMAGDWSNAFCVVRPPGHHAEADWSMGFCLFNNIAIAASYLIEQHGLKRVAVVDFDVHHGNGTQHSFEQHDDVLVIQLQEDPSVLFPGSGFAHEQGQGAGAGYTMNLPMPVGAGDEEYRRAFELKILPKLDWFAPEAVLISAGFDAAANDPLAHLTLSTEMFRWMTERLLEVAGRHASGRVVSVLEGGYDLDNLGACAAEHVRALLAASGISSA